MTDDKSRQEGPPSADPEAESQGKIVVDTGGGKYWGDMSPHEFSEYAAEHPEVLDEFRTRFAESLGPVIAESIAAVQTLATAQSAAATVARQIADFQARIAETAQAVARAHSLIPEWASAEELDAFFDEIEELKPFLDAEIKKYPQYEGKTFLEVLDRLPFGAVYSFITDDRPQEPAEDQEAEPTEGQEPIKEQEAEPAEGDEQENDPERLELFRIIDDLLEIRRAARAAQIAQQAIENAPRATSKPAHDIEYPLDKPNSIVWNLLEKDTAGQVSFNLAKSGSRQYIPAYYSINFDHLGSDIKITKRLTPFDKRVYIAISALFCAGNEIMSIAQIYYAMGYTGTPGESDYTKINDSITKMTNARIFFDNETEAKKYKYDRFLYDGSLLPLERGTGIINGKVSNMAIFVFRDPPLMTFARQRKQITTINVKLLQSPVSKTNDNLLIEDYLIERICKAKKKEKGKKTRRTERILFKTLYERAGIKTKKQIQRAPGKIKKYLDHQQQENLFSSYVMDNDGITVFF